MDFFDNALDKAKEAFDIVSKKTGEVVTAQKQKFDVASLESKRAKDFEKLGEIYFGLIKDAEIEDQETKALVEAIIKKENEIFQLKDELNAAKYQRICPNCQANISKTAVYCSACGMKLEIEE